MKNAVYKSEAEILHVKADELLKKKKSKTVSSRSEAQALKLIHELEVQQTELLLINEKLRLAKEQEIKHLTDKYAELYDLVPFGYFTLTMDGKIIELNSYGASMLGKDPSHLKNARFENFVSNDTKPNFHHFLSNVFSSKTNEICELNLSTNAKIPLYVHVTGIVTSNAELCFVSMVDITERKKAEEALLKSEERFTKAFRSIPDALIISHLEDGKIIEVNESWQKLFGYNIDEVIGKSSYALNLFVDPADRERTIALLHEQSFIRNFELQIRQKSGELRLVNLSVELLELHGEQYMLTIAQDITERKQVFDALCVSEKKYHTLFNAIDEGFCIAEVIFDESEKPIDYRFLEINPSFEKQTGLIKAQGMRMRELAPKHEEYWFEIYGKIALTGQPSRFENHAEQLHRWYDVYAFRVDQPEKRHVAILFNDITKRKQMEDTLKKTETFLQTVLSNVPITIFTIDNQGIFTLSEGKGLERAGLAPGENIGVSAFDLFGSKSFVESTGKVTSGKNIILRTLSGETINAIDELNSVYFDNYIGPMRDTEGKVIGIVGVTSDITERMQVERELKESKERYRELFENINTGVAVYEVRDDGRDFIFKDFNRAAETMDRVTRERLIGKSIFEVRPEIEEFGLLDVFRRVWKTGNPEPFPMKMYKDNQLTGWYENFIYKLPTGEIVAVFENVTERKLADEELRASEGRFRGLFENMFEGYAYCQMIFENNQATDWIYLDVNDKFEKLTGLKDVKGKMESEVIPSIKELDPQLFETYSRISLGNSPEHFDMYVESFQEWVSLSVYCPEKGFFISVFEVITPRKRAENKLKNAYKVMLELYNHQEEVKENERKAISRQIHDELGQLLTALKIDIGWTSDNLQNIAKVKKRLKGMNDIVNDTITSVQRISSDLRPGILDDLGLTPALEWYCQNFEKRTGIKCLFKSDDVSLTNEYKNITLYRVLQEALTNVIRHAKAKSVNVNLHQEGNSIVLEVIDDGTGMDQEKIDSYNSLGLIGMRERIIQFNGNLVITSARNKGTKLSIKIPLNK